MEIKKCASCGSFISSGAAICATCANKASYEKTLLKNYFDENTSFDSISSVSATTGVSFGSVQKYIQDNNYLDSDVSATTFNPIQY
ncbi:MAG: hypothetical protein IJO08_04570 [Clostridia bacterium]|nr:hypothetical protein [Clostridia bacterium]